MRHVLVVGGRGALGGAVVERLLARGAAVSVVGRSGGADGRLRFARAVDATHADWPALYHEVEDAAGLALAGVVFVAGAGAYGRTAAVPRDEARAAMELNFWACAAAATAAGEHWARLRRPGTFAAVLSIVARRAVPFEAWYAASKAAAARFLEALDLEYRPRGVRFVAAYPGTLATPFRRGVAWHGMAPAASSGGASLDAAATAVIDLLDGRRRARVIGWRERTVDLADRLAPGLYDRAVLARRVKRMRREEGAG